MSWNEEKVAKLKELWGKVNTASEIAKIIGGISRNAVIGKAHRLNLSAKIKTRTAASNQNFENSLDERIIFQDSKQLLYQLSQLEHKQACVSASPYGLLSKKLQITFFQKWLETFSLNSGFKLST